MADPIDLIRVRIEAFCGHTPKGRYLLEHGKPFVPIMRPKGLRKCADRKCFCNAQRAVLHEQVALYCEGFAFRRGSMFVHHAWVSNDGEQAIELTWREPGRAYFGSAYTWQQVAARLKAEGLEEWFAPILF